MIVVLFGQPHSGKSTLALELAKKLSDSEIIDGDKFREIFKNTDYSKEGRIKNLTKACDIGYYMHETLIKSNVIYSMVFPYEEVRSYIKELHPETHFFYLTYQEPRGRENYHVEDFDYPKVDNNTTIIDTDKYTVKESINQIIEILWDRNGQR